MSKLHFVFGGRVKDPRGLDFDLDTVEMVGLYPDYASALDAWRGKAQRYGKSDGAAQAHGFGSAAGAASAGFFAAPLSWARS